MGKVTIFDRLRWFIAGVAWRIFLLANRMTEEEYIYRILREYNEPPEAE